MQTNKKKYGFTVSLYEYEATIPTLWQTTRGASSSFVRESVVLTITPAAEFIDANPQYLAKPNAMNWVSNDGGKTVSSSSSPLLTATDFSSLVQPLPLLV